MPKNSDTNYIHSLTKALNYRHVHLLVEWCSPFQVRRSNYMFTSHSTTLDSLFNQQELAGHPMSSGFPHTYDTAV